MTVYCRGAAPVLAHRMEIGAFASKVPSVPLGMTGNIPETSRLLEALKRNTGKTTDRWRGRFPSGSMGRRRAGMYESFFEMEHTPFTRDIPVEWLYTSLRIEEALGRLVYVVDHQMSAVVTSNPGYGKSTMVRMLDGRLGKEKYLLLYLSDSKLTPRWLYAGLLGQLGLEPHYFSGDSKRLLQKEIRAVSTEQQKKVVCVRECKIKCVS